MPLPISLITPEQLENRIGVEIVKRIFDDYNVGEASSQAVRQLCEDASSKVRASVGQDYDLDALTPQAAASTAIELRRIALDCAHAMAAQRHPGAIKLDGFAMMEQVNLDLKAIRLGQASLGTKTAPAPADQTVSVVGNGFNTRSYWP